MNLPSTLDIAIGLVFIFLILSLLASEIQELVTTLLQWRAKHLKNSIEVLLAGGIGTQQEESVRKLVKNLYDDPLIRNINQGAKGWAEKFRGITRLFVPGNRKGSFGIDQSTGPSYIAPETFATSLLEQVGLENLSRKLTEVRLEKFTARIIGSYDGGQGKNSPVSIPPDTDERIVKQLWNKGRVRLIAEKAKLTADGQPSDLSKEPRFQTLVEEFDNILYEFETEGSNLVTSIERIGESFSNYISSYEVAETKAQGVDLNSQTNSSEDNTNPEFAERLEAFRRDIFGQKSERAIVSGGLRPSLLEIAELLDQTSATYKEVEESYKTLLFEGEMLDQDMLPLLAEILLYKYTEIVEKQLAAQYSADVKDYLKEYFRVNNTSLFPKLEEDLQKIEEKLRIIEAETSKPSVTVNRTRQQSAISRMQSRIVNQEQKLTTDKLKHKQQRTIVRMFGWVSEDDSPALLATLLNQKVFFSEKKYRSNWVDSVCTSDQPQKDLAEFVNGSLSRLSNEDRRISIDEALMLLSSDKRWNQEDAKKQRSLYNNYYTYKTIRQVLNELPFSIKESFAILARRAQTRVKETGDDMGQFRQEVSLWFDRSMSRATGVYKRNTKGVVFFISLFLAVLVNVDSGFIVTRLSNDETLRQAVAEKAISATSSEELETFRDDTKAVLEELALPIGFSPENLSQQLGCSMKAVEKPQNRPSDWSEFYDLCLDGKQPSVDGQAIGFGKTLEKTAAIALTYWKALLRIFLGWLIAGLAISMGAPFWFDILSKIMNVRNTGSRPLSIEEQATVKTSEK